MCRRRGLKVKAGKSKVIIMNGKEGLEYEIPKDRIRIEHVSEFKYLGCILDESGTDGPEFRRKVTSGRRVAGAIRSLVNTRSLQLECAIGLHELLLVSVLIYGSETMIWKEKERSRIRAVQMDNFRGLLGIRKWIKS